MKLLFTILIFSLAACTTKESKVREIINKEIGENIRNGIVLITSKENCIPCHDDNIYSWIDYSNDNNIPFWGYFIQRI